MGSHSDDRPGHIGHDHREPGRYNRCLLDDAASDSARALAAHEHSSHIRDRTRPDLYSGRKLEPAAGGAVPHGNVQDFQLAGLGVRHRGDRDHGGDGRARRCRGPVLLAVVVVARRPGDGAVSMRRSHFSGSQSPEDSGRRVVAPGRRRGAFDRHADLEARRTIVVDPLEEGGAAARRVPSRVGEEIARAGVRHGRVSDKPSRSRPNGADA